MDLLTAQTALKQNEAELALARQNADLLRMHELLVARSLLKDIIIELLQSIKVA